MRQPLPDEEQIRRYLLGELSEAEMARLEDDAFAGPGGEDLQAAIAAAEDDLMDEYARGELSPGARARFEARFLTSEGRWRRVGFAAALAAVEGAQGAAEGAQAAARPTGARHPLDSILAFFRPPSPAFKFALISAALALLAGGAWYASELSRRRAETAQVETERRLVEERARDEELTRARQGALNPQGPAGTPPVPSPQASPMPGQAPRGVEPRRGDGRPRASAPTLASFTLLPGSLRGEGDGPQVITVPEGSRLVRLQLVIDDVILRGGVRAEVFAGERKVLSRAGLKVRRARSGNIVTLDVPAERLAPGTHLVKLEGQTADGAAVTTLYNFKVLSK